MNGLAASANAQKPGEQKGLSSVLQGQFQVGTHSSGNMHKCGVLKLPPNSLRIYKAHNGT